VEAVPIDLDVAPEGHVGGSDEAAIVPVSVLVLAPLQELALHYPRVLLRGLIYGYGVVCEEEGHDESAVHILWHLGVEPCYVSQDSLVIVDVFEEVSLGLLGEEAEDVAEGVDLISETIVGRDLSRGGVTGLRVLDLTQWEVTSQLRLKEVLSELVDTLNIEVSTERLNGCARVDLIVCQVIIAHEYKTRLSDCERVRDLPTLEKLGKVVTAIIGGVHFSNLYGIIRQVVVHDEGEVVPASVEAEDLAVVVQELLL
jgi:hypothetical protein